jgi:ATP synthase protein I
MATFLFIMGLVGVKGMSNQDQNQNPWRAFALVGAIGVELAISVMLGVWLGNWLDERFHTAPLFLILGIFLGLGVGIFAIIQLIKKYTGDQPNG